MKNKTRINKLKTFWEINRNKPLHKHYIFWAPILLFVPWALILSFPTWCLCWPNTANYDEILKTQGFPIFIASLAVPFTVVINRFHSSYQRAESNRLMLQNMTFNQYFEHRMHFFTYLESLKFRHPYNTFVSINDPDRLYKIVFPLNKIDYQDMSAPNDIVTEKIRNNVKEVHNYVVGFINEMDKGVDPFSEVLPLEFLSKVGESFGVHIDQDILIHVNREGKKEVKSIFHLVFYSFLEVMQSAGQFSHKNFGGWTPVMALDPLLKSLPDKKLEEFEKYLVDRIIADLGDDEIENKFKSKIINPS
ncbi:hypothetical protein [Psychrosphaera haliotis]|uniref:Uncharacterized protein n=1 Tax=Psychrosphaera haliotis TaxID=555083 RepID=A0A6N8FDG4_9GAMM|nr:hypothetical protein [Psychrosphaera haliotis]MUH73629.1 hypothetical protein [Psychrosphaera haliotis]